MARRCRRVCRVVKGLGQLQCAAPAATGNTRSQLPAVPKLEQVPASKTQDQSQRQGAAEQALHHAQRRSSRREGARLRGVGRGVHAQAAVAVEHAVKALCEVVGYQRGAARLGAFEVDQLVLVVKHDSCPAGGGRRRGHALRRRRQPRLGPGRREGQAVLALARRQAGQRRVRAALGDAPGEADGGLEVGRRQRPLRLLRLRLQLLPQLQQPGRLLQRRRPLLRRPGCRAGWLAGRWGGVQGGAGGQQQQHRSCHHRLPHVGKRVRLDGRQHRAPRRLQEAGGGAKGAGSALHP